MAIRFAILLGLAAVGSPLTPAAETFLTYDTLPTGTVERPLLLRSYLPDPGLDPAVFVHHRRTGPSPKYDPRLGRDVAGDYTPLAGLPAAIAVNHGPALSYVFDTVEARLMYAWQGGFVDMFPYWGDRQLGSRVAYDYVPRLVGTLFYQAAGAHPLEIEGASVAARGRPRYLGYDLHAGVPTFLVQYGTHRVRWTFAPVPDQAAVRITLEAEPRARLGYRVEDPRFEVRLDTPREGAVQVTVTGVPLGTHAGYPRRVTYAEASVAAGEQIARTYGCVTCHSADGSPGYGPSWRGVAGAERLMADGSRVRADAAYLAESITAPNARIVQGFAPNFMPAYTILKPVELESLVLFIQTLREAP